MIDAIKHAWGNGGRPLLYIFGVSCILVILNIAMLIAFVDHSDSPFAPVSGAGFEAPQRVKEDVVPIGGVVTTVDVEKCNSMDDPVLVRGTVTWRHLDDPDGIHLLEAGEFSGSYTPGCVITSYSNPTPLGVIPGRWVITGYEEIIHGKDVQFIAWISEEFTITEPGE